MTNESPYTLIKPMFKFLPYLSSFLFLLGVVDQAYYYYAFGVSIVSYLDLSEVLIIILDKIIRTIAFGLLLLTLAVLIRFIFKLFKRSAEENSQDFSMPAGLKFFFYTFFIASTLAPLFFRDLNQSQKLSIIFYFFMFIGIYYAFIFEKRVLKDFPPYTGLTLFIASFAFIYTLYSARDKYFRVVSQKTFSQVTIVLDSVTIKCDSSFYFIGKTKDYLFLYNEKIHNTVIYPMSRVRELNFLNRRTDRK